MSRSIFPLEMLLKAGKEIYLYLMNGFDLFFKPIKELISDMDIGWEWANDVISWLIDQFFDPNINIFYLLTAGLGFVVLFKLLKFFTRGVGD